MVRFNDIQAQFQAANGSVCKLNIIETKQLAARLAPQEKLLVVVRGLPRGKHDLLVVTDTRLMYKCKNGQFMDYAHSDVAKIACQKKFLHSELRMYLYDNSTLVFRSARYAHLRLCELHIREQHYAVLPAQKRIRNGHASIAAVILPSREVIDTMRTLKAKNVVQQRRHTTA